MPVNLITSVKREINRLTKKMTALKDELEKYQTAYQLLAGSDTKAQRSGRKRGRSRKTTPVNWNSILDQLPSRFTVRDLAKAVGAKGKSSTYVRQIAVKWKKQRKTKRIERGTYQKVQQG